MEVQNYGCCGSLCRVQGCQPAECNRNMYSVDNFPARMERHILPTIFGNVNEEQLLHLDIKNLQDLLTNVVGRFLRGIDGRADEIVKKRKRCLVEEYRAKLSMRLGKRYKIEQCSRCNRMEPEVHVKKLCCDHTLCFDCHHEMYPTTATCPVCHDKPSWNQE